MTPIPYPLSSQFPSLRPISGLFQRMHIGHHDHPRPITSEDLSRSQLLFPSDKLSLSPHLTSPHFTSPSNGSRAILPSEPHENKDKLKEEGPHKSHRFFRDRKHAGLHVRAYLLYVFVPKEVRKVNQPSIPFLYPFLHPRIRVRGDLMAG
jgi:hypothetical protein